MLGQTIDLLTRRDIVRMALLLAVFVAAALWGAWRFLESATPRRVVLASGVADGMYHRYAERYKEILARDGVTVEERMTGGAAENIQLLLDPTSGVDVALAQGGVAPADAQSIEMLATLYYEPLWIFYRSDAPITQINALLHKRIAIGIPGSGSRAFVAPLLAANGLTPFNTEQLPLGSTEALRALQRGEIDVALMVGGTQSPAIWQALHDPTIRLMDLARADAYPRRYPFISRLTLPAGTIELGQNIPPQEVAMIGTKAMLVAREGFPPALINLLLDAAHEIHGGQGIFEAADAFPATTRVDLPVSTAAQRHKEFGPNLLHRYMPFWIATFIERLIILVVPLLAILVPVVSYLPQVLRWRIRSRIYRLYGELKLLERDVASRKGPLPVDKWLQDVDRIEQAAQSIKAPVSFSSEAYTLRGHIGFVRDAVLAKAGAPPPARGGTG